MGSIYRRRRKLWMSYTDERGKRRWKSTGFEVGHESDAAKLLAQVEGMIAAGELLAGDQFGPPTFERYAEHWLKKRRASGVASVADDRSRLRLHVYPEIGEQKLTELKPRHIRQLVRSLKAKRSERKKPLAPKTIHNIYGVVHRVLEDAVADELIEVNPCVVKRGDLPAKVDSDPTWRDTEVFTRGEVEKILSSDQIPWDRRVLYSLHFLGSVRFGEAAALRFRDWDPDAEPLGRLSIHKSYDSKRQTIGPVKTRRPRAMPVHATLAAILAERELGGWQTMLGRKPEPEDILVPSRTGKHRNANHMLRRFHEDLARLGLRQVPRGPGAAGVPATPPTRPPPHLHLAGPGRRGANRHPPLGHPRAFQAGDRRLHHPALASPLRGGRQAPGRAARRSTGPGDLPPGLRPVRRRPR